MENLYIKALPPDEVPLITKLFLYKDKHKMVKENAENIENGVIAVFALFRGKRLIGQLI